MAAEAGSPSGPDGQEAAWGADGRTRLREASLNVNHTMSVSESALKKDTSPGGQGGLCLEWLHWIRMRPFLAEDREGSSDPLCGGTAHSLISMVPDVTMPLSVSRSLTCCPGTSWPRRDTG